MAEEILTARIKFDGGDLAGVGGGKKAEQSLKKTAGVLERSERYFKDSSTNSLGVLGALGKGGAIVAALGVGFQLSHMILRGMEETMEKTKELLSPAGDTTGGVETQDGTVNVNSPMEGIADSLGLTNPPTLEELAQSEGMTTHSMMGGDTTAPSDEVINSLPEVQDLKDSVHEFWMNTNDLGNAALQSTASMEDLKMSIEPLAKEGGSLINFNLSVDNATASMNALATRANQTATNNTGGGGGGGGDGLFGVVGGWVDSVASFFSGGG